MTKATNSFPWPYLWFWKDQWNPETSQDITYSPDSVNVTLKATQKGQIGWKFHRFYPAHACALALKSTWQLRWKQCYQFLTYIMRWNSNAAIAGVFWKKIPQQSGYTVAKLGSSHLRGQSKDKSCNLWRFKASEDSSVSDSRWQHSLIQIGKSRFLFGLWPLLNLFRIWRGLLTSICTTLFAKIVMWPPPEIIISVWHIVSKIGWWQDGSGLNSGGTKLIQR